MKSCFAKRKKRVCFVFKVPYRHVFCQLIDSGGISAEQKNLPSSVAAWFLLCLTSHSREKVEPFEEGVCWHKPWLRFIQKGELVFIQSAFGC